MTRTAWWTLLIVLSLCAARAEAREPKGWINPAEMAFSDGRLYFTGWVSELPAKTSATFKLSGKGVKEQTVERKVKPYGVVGDYAKWGVSICAGIGLDRDRQSGKARVDFQSECSFDGNGMSPNVPYTISALVDGREVGSAQVLLVEEPEVGGKRSLRVDPAQRAGKLYSHPAGLVYWLLSDARMANDLVTITWFRDEQVTESQVLTLNGPNLVESPLLRDVQPLILKNPEEYRMDNRDKLVAEWRAVILLNGETPVVSLHSKVSEDASGMLKYDAVEEVRPGGYGPMKAVNIPPEILSAAKKNAKEMIATRAPEIRAQAGGRRSETLVCAVAREPRALQLIKSLSELGHVQIGLTDDYAKAGRTIDSRFSTSAERANARRTQQSALQGAGGAASAVKRVNAELTNLSRKQKPGCLSKLFPSQAEPAI